MQTGTREGQFESESHSEEEEKIFSLRIPSSCLDILESYIILS